jgi:hypothetical protein
MESKFNGFNSMDQEEHVQTSEIDTPAKTEVIELAENGLGFGEGAISVSDRLGSEEDGLSQENLDKTREGIRSPLILKRIGADDEGSPVRDDGCPDGRGVLVVFDRFKEYGKSLARPKVFGGGATMAFSALVGLGQAKEGPTETFEAAAGLLEEREVDYGAHSDDHATGSATGCGAIDRAEDIIANVSKYNREIADTMYSVARAVGHDSETLGGNIDFVMDNFRTFKNNCDGQSTGADRLKCIEKRNKIIKKLRGDHQEVRIVLNTVEDHTVDQEYIRTLSEEKAQVFGVDVWRLQEISEGMFPGDEQAKERSFLSMLAYSLGTAATLTKGDLPVDLITPAD